MARKWMIGGMILVALTMLFYTQTRVKITEFADVTGQDLRRSHSLDEDLFYTLRFDHRTLWPDQLPPGFKPSHVLEVGKDPGLGLRALHNLGITGGGVGVAVIDGHLLKEHQEYADRLLSYHARLGSGVNRYHGTMAVSVMAGNTVGVAPGTSIHYFEGDLSRREQIPTIIREIIAFNHTLPTSEQIRVISISLGATEQYQLAWEEAITEANASGIFVVRSDWLLSSIGCPVGLDRDDFSQYQVGNAFSFGESYPKSDLLVPTDYRSVAHGQDEKGYIFTARGGMSLGIPYFSGLVALGLQLNPNLPLDQIIPMMQETGDPFPLGGIVVNPARFLRRVAEKTAQTVP